MRFTKALMSSAVVAAAFSGTTAYAAGPTLSEVMGNSGITVFGAADMSYDWSKNDAVLGRAFDTENDAFVFHQANLSATKAFEGGFGLGLNAILGKDANVVSGDLLDGDDFDLTQAYITKSFGNLTVQAGRYVTLAGMEVINPAGNINASRSLLFTLQPLVHEGVRATYKVNDMLAVTLGLNNAQFATSCGPSAFALGFDGCTQAGAGGEGGFGGQRDNNTDTTVEAQIALTPSKQLSIFLTGYTGNEDPSGGGEGFFDDADIRMDTLDLVVNFNLTEALYMGLNANYFNTEVDGGGEGGHSETKGVAGYVGFNFMPKWRVAARSEYVAFDDGSQGDFIVRENTLTLAHAVSSNFELLVEGRHDRATGDRFPDMFANINGDINGDRGFFNEDDQYTATIKGILKF